MQSGGSQERHLNLGTSCDSLRLRCLIKFLCNLNVCSCWAFINNSFAIVLSSTCSFISVSLSLSTNDPGGNVTV